MVTFPESRRVRYERNPLIEVICQLKFPKLLHIETEPPVALQDSVRDVYPHFHLVDPIEIAVAENPGAAPREVRLHQRPKSYGFLNRERDWKFVVAGDFLALSTTAYSTWPDFRQRLDFVLTSFSKHYSPAFFTRIGLRYQDVIDRSTLALSECSWSQLLNPAILGPITTRPFHEDEVTEFLSVLLCALDSPASFVRIRYGLAKQEQSKETGFLIDADFFSQNPTEIANAPSTLDSFNVEAGRLFRWCLTPRLHEAMAPQPL